MLARTGQIWPSDFLCARARPREREIKWMKKQKTQIRLNYECLVFRLCKMWWTHRVEMTNWKKCSASVCFFIMTCWTLAYDVMNKKEEWNEMEYSNWMCTGHGFRARWVSHRIDVVKCQFSAFTHRRFGPECVFTDVLNGSDHLNGLAFCLVF